MHWTEKFTRSCCLEASPYFLHILTSILGDVVPSLSDTLQNCARVLNPSVFCFWSTRQFSGEKNLSLHTPSFSFNHHPLIIHSEYLICVYCTETLVLQANISNLPWSKCYSVGLRSCALMRLSFFWGTQGSLSMPHTPILTLHFSLKIDLWPKRTQLEIVCSTFGHQDQPRRL